MRRERPDLAEYIGTSIWIGAAVLLLVTKPLLFAAILAVIIAIGLVRR